MMNLIDSSTSHTHSADDPITMVYETIFGNDTAANQSTSTPHRLLDESKQLQLQQSPILSSPPATSPQEMTRELVNINLGPSPTQSLNESATRILIHPQAHYPTTTTTTTTSGHSPPSSEPAISPLPLNRLPTEETCAHCINMAESEILDSYQQDLGGEQKSLHAPSASVDSTTSSSSRSITPGYWKRLSPGRLRYLNQEKWNRYLTKRRSENISMVREAPWYKRIFLSPEGECPWPCGRFFGKQHLIAMILIIFITGHTKQTPTTLVHYFTDETTSHAAMRRLRTNEHEAMRHHHHPPPFAPIAQFKQPTEEAKDVVQLMERGRSIESELVPVASIRTNHSDPAAEFNSTTTFNSRAAAANHSHSQPTSSEPDSGLRQWKQLRRSVYAH